MKWIINDQAINNVYNTTDQLIEALMPILLLRSNAPIFKQSFFCSRLFGTLQLTTGYTFSESIFSYHDRDVKTLILNWVTKSGPFWDDIRENNPDDYFEYQNEDVTDYGLGECARSECNNVSATSVSVFLNSNNQFHYTPLQIQHGLEENVIGYLDIDNVWMFSDLKESISAAIPLPEDWEQSLAYFSERFNRLQFSPKIIEKLKPHPFSINLINRICELCSVLQAYIESRDADGKNTERTNEIIANYFSGKKAWFSDESPQNKIKFKADLTFPDPTNNGNVIFAPFHGKVKTPQFRIHFPWPIGAHETHLTILYIGPKITKK